MGLGKPNGNWENEWGTTNSQERTATKSGGLENGM